MIQEQEMVKVNNLQPEHMIISEHLEHKVQSSNLIVIL